MAGAVIGGAGGSLGGPVGAGAGAGLGYAAGEVIKASDEEADSVATNIKTIKALSEGDISKLVELQLEQESNGWMDKVLDEIYGLLKLSAIGFALYLLIPILYTKYLHKKNERHK
jgi:hypothetical protein